SESLRPAQEGPRPVDRLNPPRSRIKNEAAMGTISRRKFRPTLDSVQLEARLVLSAAATIQPAAISAAAVDPLNPVTFKTFRNSYITDTVKAIHTSFQTFTRNYN